MKNPARPRSWIRNYGSIGLLLAGVTTVMCELLDNPRLRIAWSVTGIVARVMMATTTLILVSDEASGQAEITSLASTPKQETSVRKPPQFKLTRLATGMSWLDRSRAPRNGEIWASLAGFKATELGKPAPWEPVGIEVTDGKGKKWSWSARRNEHHGAETLHLFVMNPAEDALTHDEIREVPSKGV